MEKKFKVDPVWRHSKEEIWDDIFKNISTPEKNITLNRGLFTHRKTYLYAAAALLAILLVPFLYSKDVYTERAEHLKYLLPDGTSVFLNAESRISYKPLLWFAVREVNLYGEAFFEVTSGRPFKVNAGTGYIEVLGTSFNLYSRESRLNVFCSSGIVRVTLNADKSNPQIIKGGESVEAVSETLEKRTNYSDVIRSQWVERRYSFISEPLLNVVEELERQYNIDIIIEVKSNLLYTGSFELSSNPEDVMEIVALPFSLNIVKKEDGVYIIK
mgnify:FL=1